MMYAEKEVIWIIWKMCVRELNGEMMFSDIVKEYWEKNLGSHLRSNLPNLPPWLHSEVSSSKFPPKFWVNSSEQPSNHPAPPLG